jgi:hypothetical protein
MTQFLSSLAIAAMLVAGANAASPASANDVAIETLRMRVSDWTPPEAAPGPNPLVQEARGPWRHPERAVRQPARATMSGNTYPYDGSRPSSRDRAAAHHPPPPPPPPPPPDEPPPPEPEDEGMAAVMLLDSDDTMPLVARPRLRLDQSPWYQRGR